MILTWRCGHWMDPQRQTLLWNDSKMGMAQKPFWNIFLSFLIILRGINTDFHSWPSINPSAIWIFFGSSPARVSGRSNTRQDPRVLAVDRWLIRAEFYDDCFQAAEPGGPGGPQWCWGQRLWISVDIKFFKDDTTLLHEWFWVWLCLMIFDLVSEFALKPSSQPFKQSHKDLKLHSDTRCACRGCFMPWRTISSDILVPVFAQLQGVCATVRLGSSALFNPVLTKSHRISTAKYIVLPGALSKHCKLGVILAFLKSSGRGPVRHCTSHPEAPLTPKPSKDHQKIKQNP